jgi:hypothetical protein
MLKYPSSIKVSCMFLVITLTACGGDMSMTAPAVTVSPSILTIVSTAGTITTRGSTVDPHGLAIAPATAGLITKRDLIACNFYNDSMPVAQGGVQGTGTTIGGGLHPAAGATPNRIDQSASLDGCCTSGSPGMIFGPAGLTYDSSNDTLYVVDTSSASVIAIVGISNVSKDGLVVNGQCAGAATTPTPAPTFSGPSMTSARVIGRRAPLNTPLSAALIKNSDSVVANADIGIQAS